MMTHENDYYDNSIFWVEVERIQPNPYQPRKAFDESSLQSLADSIRQYGVLQPLVVTRQERERPDGGISVEYELVAGERRLRASKMAAIRQVPVLIRSSEYSDKMKLEVAIIENLQREDLNPIDRAKAFKQLAEQFSLKHGDIAERVGKSREYVSNSMRLLMLPETMQSALINKKVSEGHTRALLMLAERPEEQEGLFREIMERKLTVRETERIARNIAVERKRKQDLSPDLIEMQQELTEKLGTRVRIEQKENGGKVHIDFFSPEDMHHVLELLASVREKSEAETATLDEVTPATTLESSAPTEPHAHDDVHTQTTSEPRETTNTEALSAQTQEQSSPLEHFVAQPPVKTPVDTTEDATTIDSVDHHQENTETNDAPVDLPAPAGALHAGGQAEEEREVRTNEPEKNEDTNLYSIRNFSL